MHISSANTLRAMQLKLQGLERELERAQQALSASTQQVQDIESKLAQARKDQQSFSSTVGLASQSSLQNALLWATRLAALVQAGEVALEAAKTNLEIAQNRVNALALEQHRYKTLVERAEKSLAVLAEKRLQKQMDEFATQSFVRRRAQGEASFA